LRKGKATAGTGTGHWASHAILRKLHGNLSSVFAHAIHAAAGFLGLGFGTVLHKSHLASTTALAVGCRRGQGSSLFMIARNTAICLAMIVVVVVTTTSSARKARRSVASKHASHDSGVVWKDIVLPYDRDWSMLLFSGREIGKDPEYSETVENAQ
jgi:hypothetical protein